MVQQSQTLLAATIFDNIRYELVGTPHENAGMEDSQKLVHDAAKIANARGFITRLPEGYGTLVGEAGVLVSGGQK